MTNDVEKICVKRVTLFGKNYLKTSDNVLYDPKTKKEVGTYDPKMNIICEIVYDDEDEQEDNESGRVSRSWGRLYLCRDLKVIAARKWRDALVHGALLKEKRDVTLSTFSSTTPCPTWTGYYYWQMRDKARIRARIIARGSDIITTENDDDGDDDIDCKAEPDPYSDFVFPVFQDGWFI